MAGFDIIDSAGNGYLSVWRERDYLLRLAAPVVLVKALCMGAVSILGFEQEFLRQALVMLPASFAEGWLAVHLVRLLLFGERVTDQPDPRAATAGMLVFVLGRFALMGLAALAFAMPEGAGIEGALPDESGPPGLAAFAGAAALFALAIWGFRYLWLYIPAAAGVPMRGFLRDLGGFTVSLNMIGVWLIGFIPFLLLLAVISGFLVGADAREGLTVPGAVVFVAIQAALDTATTLVTTAAMVRAFRMRRNRDE